MKFGKELIRLSCILLIFIFLQGIIGVFGIIINNLLLLIGLAVIIVLELISKFICDKENKKYYINVLLFFVIPGAVLYTSMYIFNLKVYSLYMHTIDTQYYSYLYLLANWIFPIYSISFIFMYGKIFKYRKDNGLDYSLIKNTMLRNSLKSLILIVFIGGILLISFESIIIVGPNKNKIIKNIESVFNENGQNIKKVSIEEINEFDASSTVQPCISSNKKKFWFVGEIGNIQVTGNIIYKKEWDKWKFCNLVNLKDGKFEGIPNIYLEKQSLVGEKVLGVTVKNADDIKIIDGNVNFNNGYATYWILYKDDKSCLKEELSFNNINNTWKFSNIGFVENENTLKFYNEM